MIDIRRMRNGFARILVKRDLLVVAGDQQLGADTAGQK